MRKLTLFIAMPLLLAALPAMAADDVAQLKQELDQTKAMMKKLESRLAVLEQNKSDQQQAAVAAPAGGGGGKASDNAFNPAVSAVLMGGFNAYTRNPSGAKLPGFALGSDAGLPDRGFSLGESEITLASNIDQSFHGALTASLAENNGDTSINLEEAYIETLAMPYGTKIKAGRMLPVFGYMNEIHTHADSFVDRPLPYRAFLGGDSFNDDGVQFSMVLPTDLFAEIGGGAFRGTAFPAAGADSRGVGAETLFARMGGDIGVESSWLAGLSYLRSEADNRVNDSLNFNGTTNLYGADVKYVWAPNGNQREKSLTLQGEYFLRNEDGTYNAVPYDEYSSGWYAQAVYKFAPQWKTGYRYSALYSPGSIPVALNGTDLDSSGHDASTHSLLLEFDNSEFSSIRLQYSHDDAMPRSNDELMLRYTVSMGAHGAHQY